MHPDAILALQVGAEQHMFHHFQVSLFPKRFVLLPALLTILQEKAKSEPRHVNICDIGLDEKDTPNLTLLLSDPAFQNA